MSPVRPNFLVIGAQKCATSWLFRQLSRHPDIYMPPEKETAFFAYTRHLVDPGPANYFSRFSAAGNAIAVGEATPAYFWSPGAPRHGGIPAGFQPDIPGAVRQLLGDEVRLLLTLRDPADRALSAWAHYVAHGELSPDAPFEAAMAYGGTLAMGFYAHHLRQWLRCFDRSQIMLLTVEGDIQPDPAMCARRAQAFVGVQPMAVAAMEAGERVFTGTPRQRLADGSLVFGTGDEAAARRVPLARVSASEQDWLRSVYADDVIALQALTGVDVANLWGYR